MTITREPDNPTIRPAAVADMFYPGDPEQLRASIRGYLQQVQVPLNEPQLKAIIAPHAGYVYSGPVAASVYARIASIADRITRVVLVGPSHRVPFYGCAVSSADQFATPLGNIPLDRPAIDALVRNGLAIELDEAHAMEHSLEVHLPFLQMVLNDFLLIPVVAGEAGVNDVSRLLSAVWGGPETLIVISSDLSHFHDYDTASRMDHDTCKKFEALDFQSLKGELACGFIPVRGLLYLAGQQGLQVETVDYRNSGDTAGSRDRVVGYAACVVH
jgi:hypothetical protein